MKRVAIGQAGGPTSVINATLVGLVKELMNDYKISFILNGYDGLVHEDIMEGTNEIIKWVVQHEHIPGACLGSGRYLMSENEITGIVNFLKRENINVLVFIGGNGTMEALHKVDLEATRQGYELQVIGLPKTVDNDINYTDHAPGFGSAAKYVAHTTRDLSYDLRSMKNFEQVRIIETMGRNAGWLTAASGFLKKHEEEGPHFIALPERQLSKEKLLDAVESAVSRHGYAIAVVSEGVLWDEGHQVGKTIINNRPVLGGISTEVEKFLSEQLNVEVRSDILGMNQRCFSSLVSEADKKEAYLTGATGGRWIKQEFSSVVVTIQRSDEADYKIQMKPIALKDVAVSGERLMPDYFIDNPKKYYKWLSPIIDGSGITYPNLSPKNGGEKKKLRNN
ncbi:diphosphate--fructose-6-phosphate 1-phosphotransferase [Virgibacillus indicus]|uniref:diphosphate--fructose-6-phosphate 1-phosphotransferase n=1 Tax=Virgibacillus indicus TaxID=2024554 RepID=UPI0013FE1E32|nr:diphosphate--fructose-6-phosphate 1-phosphotransferase [Virgibacillus indicus]